MSESFHILKTEMNEAQLRKLNFALSSDDWQKVILPVLEDAAQGYRRDKDGKDDLVEITRLDGKVQMAKALLLLDVDVKTLTERADETARGVRV